MKKIKIVQKFDYSPAGSKRKIPLVPGRVLIVGHTVTKDQAKKMIEQGNAIPIGEPVVKAAPANKAKKVDNVKK